MSFDFTEEQICSLIPNNKQASDWYAALAEVLPQYDIITPQRVAAFIAQCGHESMDFTRLRENLNYKAESLIRVWPKRFNASNVGRYAKQPEKIANYVYANRMGNGDEVSGDGWKFRGRGPIQITGKDNYTNLSRFLYEDDSLLDDPDALEQDMSVAIHSACWFWTVNNLNDLADTNDIATMTRRINGGTVGLEDRVNRFNKAIQVLGG